MSTMVTAVSSLPTLANKLSEPPVRRSANYKLSAWNFNYIQSLNNPYKGDVYVKRAENLKQNVQEMLEKGLKEELEVLELIDDLQRLGLSYHFKTQIKQVLGTIFEKYNNNKSGFNILKQTNNLYAKSLMFRLLRQHGFHVSQEIFDSFKDERGNFKMSCCEDTKGMLNLYEASYLSLEGEDTMDMAREFTSRHLKKNLDEKKLGHTGDDDHAALVGHALELPRHWRINRLEARYFIDVYARRANMNPLLLELAKLNFNLVQAVYQEDLKDVSRWWQNRGIMEKLPYTRDCIVPSLFWHIGVVYEPQHGHARRMLAKIFALLTILDDTYDVYGTIEELQLFTDVIKRWDINAINELPYYMKICFLAIYNYVSEMGYDALRDHGINTIPYLKKMWLDQCNAYFQEAKWYSKGYKPTLEEYKRNSMVSIGVPVSLIHGYLLVENPIKEEGLEAICNYHDIVRCSSNIFRCTDDLGTSKDELERGDVPKLLQCYMNETGASEEEAHGYVKNLISENWKEMNKLNAVPNPTFSKRFMKFAMDIDRASHCVYEYGDGHGNVNAIAQHRMSSMLFEPIAIENI